MVMGEPACGHAEPPILRRGATRLGGKLGSLLNGVVGWSAPYGRRVENDG